MRVLSVDAADGVTELKARTRAPALGDDKGREYPAGVHLSPLEPPFVCLIGQAWREGAYRRRRLRWLWDLSRLHQIITLLLNLLSYRIVDCCPDDREGAEF